MTLLVAVLLMCSAAFALAAPSDPLTITLYPNPPAGTPVSPGQSIAMTVEIRRDAAAAGQGVSVEARFDPGLELFSYGGDQCSGGPGVVHCAPYVASDQPALMFFAVRVPASWRCADFVIRATAPSYDGAEHAEDVAVHPQSAACAIMLPLMR